MSIVKVTTPSSKIIILRTLATVSFILSKPYTWGLLLHVFPGTSFDKTNMAYQLFFSLLFAYVGIILSHDGVIIKKKMRESPLLNKIVNITIKASIGLLKVVIGFTAIIPMMFVNEKESDELLSDLEKVLRKIDIVEDAPIEIRGIFPLGAILIISLLVCMVFDDFVCNRYITVINEVATFIGLIFTIFGIA